MNNGSFHVTSALGAPAASGADPAFVVGVSGSLANLAALHAAVDLATLWGRRLEVVTVVTPERLRRLGSATEARRRAATELVAALHDAFGGLPRTVTLDARVALGDVANALIAATRRQDVLIVGESEDRSSHSIAARCRRHVDHLEVVPRPALLVELGRLEHVHDLAGLLAS